MYSQGDQNQPGLAGKQILSDGLRLQSDAAYNDL
jgi:hypothetical protein